MIKIGEESYPVSTPERLADIVQESQGVSGAEMAALLGRSPLPGTVAQALLPFLKDPPPVHELAADIAEAGTLEVAVQVAALYSKAEEKAQTRGN
jgi:hypothetical protein